MNVVAFLNNIPKDLNIDYQRMEERLLHTKVRVLFDSLGWEYPKWLENVGKKARIQIISGNFLEFSAIQENLFENEL